MRFKTEICLLIVAIALFGVSAFLYSYPSPEGPSIASSVNLRYPYQSHAISLVGFGSLLMVTASVSFMKRSKSGIDKLELAAELSPERK